MARFAVRRLLAAVGVLFVISILTFLIFQAIPNVSQMIPAPIASDSVAGSPWRIESITFTPCVYDTTVPLRILPIVLTY